MVDMEKRLTVSKNDLERVAKEIVEATTQFSVEKTTATILTLSGDLGAGKTTLMQSLAAELGVEEVVVSPTFVIMKIYELSHKEFDKLVHIDAYRVEDSLEMNALRFTEILETPRTLVCIEWPEKIADIIPLDRVEIKLEIIDEETRALTTNLNIS